ncbi:alpha/beta hydrolase [Anaerococcus sp. DFU013_CI05]|uniref:alpha/beta hydrolase n=1 Tax=Anaerococcus sp. AH8042_DFU013_CI05 TaxID=3385202 RepID=UPI003A522580
MKIIKILLAIIVVSAIFVTTSHIAKLNTRLNAKMGNMDYRPDIKENIDKHAGEHHFEDRDIVFKTVNHYAKIMDDIFINSYDNTSLGGSYLLGEDTDLWAILIHGYTATNKTMFTIADEYYKRGFSILAPNLRGHGNSAGIFTTYGIKEKEDIKSRINWIKKSYPDAKIVLQGESLGAASAMFLIAENPKDVIACVEDCGYTSYFEMYANQFPKRLKFLAKPIGLLANLFIKPVIGADLFKSNIESIQKTQIPTLFINGAKDHLVPVEMCKKLYTAHKGKKDIHIAKGAGHAESKLYDADIYYRKIFDFLSDI